MKKLLIIALLPLLASCKKETGSNEYFTITPSAKIWGVKSQAYYNADSTIISFYSENDTTLIDRITIGRPVDQSVSLKGDSKYKITCSLSGYKDKSFVVMSTKQLSENELIPNNFEVVFTDEQK